MTGPRQEKQIHIRVVGEYDALSDRATYEQEIDSAFFVCVDQERMEQIFREEVPRAGVKVDRWLLDHLPDPTKAKSHADLRVQKGTSPETVGAAVEEAMLRAYVSRE